MAMLEKGAIPTRKNYNIKGKLDLLFKQWQGLKKNSNRKTDMQARNEADFMSRNDELFDATHANALQMMKVDEDKEFLKAQRKHWRQGKLGGVDVTLARREKRRQQRQEMHNKRLRKSCDDMAASTSTMSSLEVLSSSSFIEVSTESSDEIASPPHKPKHAKQQQGSNAKNLLDAETVAALDRTKTSDRNAVYILSAFAAAMGKSVDELRVSRSTIRRQRMNVRQHTCDTIKQLFCPGISLVVHWDSKIIVDVSCRNKCDRLAIIVPGFNVSKLLGVPKLASLLVRTRQMPFFSVLKNRILLTMW